MEEFVADEIPNRAAAISYHITLSLFPAIIFVFSVIPYLPIPDLDLRIMMFLNRVMPAGIYHDTAGIIKDIVSKQRGSVLSFGVLAALYSTTSGIEELVNAFNRCLHIRDKSNFLYSKLHVIKLTIFVLFSTLAGVGLYLISGFALEEVATIPWFHSLPVADLLYFLRTLAVGGIFYWGLTLIYRLGPKQKVTRWLNWGGVIATLLIFAATKLFSIYITNFGSYNRLYGSIGTLIAVMLWIFLLSILILIGFQFNAVKYTLKNPNPKIG